jgi:hypothetical protein
VKESLRSYIAGTGGEIRSLDGAVVVGEATGFPGVPDRQGEFSGTVRFLGHGGLLDWTLSDPQIDDESGALSVANARGERIVIAVLRDSEIPVLTTDGAAFFDGMYPPGSELDQIRFG